MPILWLGCLLQLNGLHRLYNGKLDRISYGCAPWFVWCRSTGDSVPDSQQVDEYNIAES